MAWSASALASASSWSAVATGLDERPISQAKSIPSHSVVGRGAVFSVFGETDPVVTGSLAASRNSAPKRSSCPG